MCIECMKMFILGPLGETTYTARIGLVTVQSPLSREGPPELGRFSSRVSRLPGLLPTSFKIGSLLVGTL